MPDNGRARGMAFHAAAPVASEPAGADFTTHIPHFGGKSINRPAGIRRWRRYLRQGMNGRDYQAMAPLQ